MSVWNNLSSNFKVSSSLSNFLTSVVRSNFAFTRRNNVINLIIKVSPPIKPLTWVSDSIMKMFEYSGKMSIVKGCTPDLRLSSVQPLLRKAIVGPYMYVMTEFKRNSLDGTTSDVDSNREVLEKIQNNNSLKFLTGANKTLNLFASQPVLIDLRIPSIFGTGNVKNKSDNFVGRFIITVEPSINEEEWYETIKDWDQNLSKELFDPETSEIKVSYNSIKYSLLFMSNLAKTNVLSNFGQLEFAKFTLEINTIEKNPLLSFFSVEDVKEGYVYDYTIQSTPPTNIYSNAVCQIFGCSPSDLTVFGSNSKDIDVNYLDSKDNTISSKDFVNDILPKFFFVNKYKPDSNKINVGDISTKNSKSIIYNRLTSNSISVIVYLYTGLSMDGDLTSLFPGLGPNGPKNNNNKNPKGPGPKRPDSDSDSDVDRQIGPVKPSGSPDPNTNAEDPNSVIVEVSNPGLLIDDNIESHSVDVSNQLDLLENHEESTSVNKVFNLFKRVGSATINVAKIIAPDFSTALGLSYNAYSSITRKSNPQITINTNNHSLINSLDVQNNFSVIPSLDLKLFGNQGKLKKINKKKLELV